MGVYSSLAVERWELTGGGGSLGAGRGFVSLPISAILFLFFLVPGHEQILLCHVPMPIYPALESVEYRLKSLQIVSQNKSLPEVVGIRYCTSVSKKKSD